MARRIHKGVLDFTHVDTVYVRKFRTMTFHLKPVVQNAYEIRTLGGTVEVESLLRSIFEQYDTDQEHLVMLILNSSRDVTGFKLVASGTENSVEGSRKVIFRHALLLGASAIILAHNHPNGQLKASPSDVKMTRFLLDASRYVNIEVLDHFIVGPEPNFTCSSMKEQMPDLFDVEPLDENGEG